MRMYQELEYGNALCINNCLFGSLGALVLWKSYLAPTLVQICNKINISPLVCILACCTLGKASSFGQHQIRSLPGVYFMHLPHSLIQNY